MAFFTKESLEVLRQRIDLVDVLGGFVDFKRAGAAFKALCPFHDEKTPSFMVQKGDTHYHCFGCGAHGDAITFLMTHQRLPFSEAVEYLADKFQVHLDRTEQEETKGPSKKLMRDALAFSCRLYHALLLYSQEGKSALRYLLQRGISLEFIERFEIGYAPSNQRILRLLLKHQGIENDVAEAAGLFKGENDFFNDRILFPIRAAAGFVIGFSGRKYKDETFGGKYVNTPETALFKKSKVLFGLNESRQRIAKERKAIVVEGQIDALRLIYSGLDYVVAGQGTAFGQEHVQELINLGILTVYLAFDSDKAGMQAAFKVGDLFQKAGVEAKLIRLPSGYDPDLLVKERGPEGFLKLLEDAQDYVSFMISHQAQEIDLQSPAGKNSLADLLSKQVRNWDHPVMVHESLKKLAQVLQVPESMLGVGELTINNLYLKKTAYAGHQEVDPDWVLETDLLRALLKAPAGHSAIQEIALKHLKAEDFKVPICRTLFSFYREAVQAQKPIELLAFVCQLDEKEGQKLLEELSQRKVVIDKIDRFFTEALKRMLDRNWMAEREAVRIKIQSGAHSDEEALELARQFETIKRSPPILN